MKPESSLGICERNTSRIVISLLSQEFHLIYKPPFKKKREKRKCPSVKLHFTMSLPVPQMPTPRLQHSKGSSRRGPSPADLVTSLLSLKESPALPVDADGTEVQDAGCAHHDIQRRKTSQQTRLKFQTPPVTWASETRTLVFPPNKGTATQSTILPSLGCPQDRCRHAISVGTTSSPRVGRPERMSGCPRLLA